MPTVNVVVPVWYRAQVIGRAISSVVGQDFRQASDLSRCSSSMTARPMISPTRCARSVRRSAFAGNAFRNCRGICGSRIEAALPLETAPVRYRQRNWGGTAFGVRKSLTLAPIGNAAGGWRGINQGFRATTRPNRRLADAAGPLRAAQCRDADMKPHRSMVISRSPSFMSPRRSCVSFRRR